MRLVDYGRDPQEGLDDYATPPLNPLSTSTSASEPLSGPETVMSEDTSLTSPEQVHSNGRLFSPGSGTKSAVMSPGSGGIGMGGLKSTFPNASVGGRDDKSLEDLLH